MASKKKAPTIGTIFSSDSSDDSDPSPAVTLPTPRSAKTSASESERPRRVKLRVNMTSASDQSGNDRTQSVQTTQPAQIMISDSIPEGYIPVNLTRAGTIKHNTRIQYEKADGKVVKSKYFKKCDHIAGTIVVGFSLHNKRNYAESLSNIKALFIQSNSASGGADALKDTIEMESGQWKTLRREMIISYQKDNHEYVYKAKFNAFTKGKDGSTRMSMTSERGFSYIANPDNIVKIYRHITPNDKTLAYVLEALRRLEQRIQRLEQAKTKKIFTKQ